MKLIKIVFLLAMISSTNLVAKQKSQAFLVTVKNQSIEVVSAQKKEKSVSIVVINKTSENIVSQIRTVDKVIKRFTLKARSQKSIIVETKNIDTLYYASIAPPFQSIELKFNKGPYEIPEKN